MWRLRASHKSDLVVAYPPCRLCSTLQQFRKTPIPPKEWVEVVRMLEVVVQACKRQHEDGDFSIFEHPRSAT